MLLRRLIFLVVMIALLKHSRHSLDSREKMEGAEISQVEDPQITTVETIITNDDLESENVGEVIEAETYTDEFEVSLKCIPFRVLQNLCQSSGCALCIIKITCDYYYTCYYDEY